MLVLNLKEAHEFVRDQRRCGADIRWDGYDIVLWKPTHHGFTNIRGAFRKGRWGMETRIPVTSEGTWKIASKSIFKPRVKAA